MKFKKRNDDRQIIRISHLRTSGSAFSLIVKLAEVCMMKRFAMPMFILDKSSLMMRFTCDVMR